MPNDCFTLRGGQRWIRCTRSDRGLLSVIEGGNHVVDNLWYRYRDQTAEWMARHWMAKQLGAG